MRGRWWWRGEAGDNSRSSLGGNGGQEQEEVVGLRLPCGRLASAGRARMTHSAYPAVGSALSLLNW